MSEKEQGKYDVEIIAGSSSDFEAIEKSELMDILNACGVTWRLSSLSAHRNPYDLDRFVQLSKETAKVFIGIAGMAAALPGTIAAHARTKPVIGVALSSDILDGMDAAFAISRMPSGVPVAFTGWNKTGLYNAGILAVQMIAAVGSHELQGKLLAHNMKTDKPPKIGYKTSDTGGA